MLTQLRKSIVWEYLNVALVVVLIFSTLIYAEIYFTIDLSDYGSHITWAEGILHRDPSVPASVIAHASWQWGVILVQRLLGISWQFSALVFTMISQVATAWLIYTLIRKHLAPLISGVLAIGLMVIAPILVVEPFMNLWYMVNGYIAINVYHNPTILLLKPLVIFQVIFAVKCLVDGRANVFFIVAAVIVSAVAAYTKPNYVLCLLPALGILVLIRLINKKPSGWRALLLGIAVPSILILAWQYLITFGPKADSSIIFAPLSVMHQYSSNLLTKLLLSIAFPLIVTVIYFKEAIRDVWMQIGWIGFFFGLVFTYLFAESGNRSLAANFVWNGEITLFVLFLCCVLLIVRQGLPQSKPLQRWVIFSAAFLHLLFGVFYFFFHWFTLWNIA